MIVRRGGADLAPFLRPIAHRGLHDAARGRIENSASAARAAIIRGYGIELDLQPARDMTPMVFHDATLDRLTEEAGPLEARDAEELQNIRLAGSEDRILTLTAFLALVAGRVPLLVEVKSTAQPRPAFWRAIGAALGAYRGPAAVMSFDPRAVAGVARHVPALPRGLVSCAFDSAQDRQWLDAPTRFRLRNLLDLVEVGADFIAYDVRALPSLAPLRARRHLGRPLFAWTVRTAREAARARQWADAMIFEGWRPGGLPDHLRP